MFSVNKHENIAYCSVWLLNENIHLKVSLRAWHYKLWVQSIIIVICVLNGNQIHVLVRCFELESDQWVFLITANHTNLGIIIGILAETCPWCSSVQLFCWGWRWPETFRENCAVRYISWNHFCWLWNLNILLTCHVRYFVVMWIGRVKWNEEKEISYIWRTQCILFLIYMLWQIYNLNLKSELDVLVNHLFNFWGRKYCSQTHRETTFNFPPTSLLIEQSWMLRYKLLRSKQRWRCKYNNLIAGRKVSEK